MSGAKGFLQKMESGVAKAGSDVATFTKRVTMQAGDKLNRKRWTDPAGSGRFAGGSSSSATTDGAGSSGGLGPGPRPGGGGGSPAAAVMPPSGHLAIWHGRWGRWRRRYFSVDAAGGALVYHSGAGSAHRGATWAIALHQAVVKHEGASGRRFRVAASAGTYHFKAATREAANAWVDALREAVSLGLERRLGKQPLVPGRSGSAPGTGAAGAGAAAGTDALPGARREVLARMVDERVEAHMQSLTPYAADIEEQLGAARADVLRALHRLSLSGEGAPEVRGSPIPPRGPTAAGDSRLGRALSSSSPGGGLSGAGSANEQWHDAEDHGSAWWEEGGEGGGGGALDGSGLRASWAQLLERVEAVLRREAMRLLELEEENAALRSTAADLRASLAAAGPSAMEGGSTSAMSAAAIVGIAPGGRGGGISGDDAALRDGMRGEAAVVSSMGDLAGAGITEPDDDSDEDASSEAPVRRGSLMPLQRLVPVPAGRRERLPGDQPKEYGFSIWSVLKQAIGRDLTRITMPATINEPLSSVQRVLEEFEHRHLLARALASADPADRLLYVSVFALSAYGSSLPRVNKPFNPLLGETFEWESPAGDFTFVCEQVSHHPPISCWYGEGRAPADASAGQAKGGGSYELFGEIETRSQFWGKSVNVMPTGASFLRLKPAGDGQGEELYSWCKATCSINNIIWGKPYIDWAGEIVVQNRTTGDFARLQLPKCNGRLDERGVVEGAVCDRDGNPLYTISGSYADQLVAAMTAGLAQRRGIAQRPRPEVVFCMNPPPEWAGDQYNMSALAMQLNELLPEHGGGRLPPTDSRLRTDQRFLEDGEWDKATTEKLRLEEKQRAARKVLAAKGEKYAPLWFDLQRTRADGTTMVADPDASDEPPCWQWNGRYKERRWDACPDIYSEHMPVVPQ